MATEKRKSDATLWQRKWDETKGSNNKERKRVAFWPSMPTPCDTGAIAIVVAIVRDAFLTHVNVPLSPAHRCRPPILLFADLYGMPAPNFEKQNT